MCITVSNFATMAFGMFKVIVMELTSAFFLYANDIGNKSNEQNKWNDNKNCDPTSDENYFFTCSHWIYALVYADIYLFPVYQKCSKCLKEMFENSHGRFCQKKRKHIINKVWKGGPDQVYSPQNVQSHRWKSRNENPFVNYGCRCRRTINWLAKQNQNGYRIWWIPLHLWWLFFQCLYSKREITLWMNF